MSEPGSKSIRTRSRSGPVDPLRRFWIWLGIALFLDLRGVGWLVTSQPWEAFLTNLLPTVALGFACILAAPRLAPGTRGKALAWLGTLVCLTPTVRVLLPAMIRGENLAVAFSPFPTLGAIGGILNAWLAGTAFALQKQPAAPGIRIGFLPAGLALAALATSIARPIVSGVENGFDVLVHSWVQDPVGSLRILLSTGLVVAAVPLSLALRRETPHRPILTNALFLATLLSFLLPGIWILAMDVSSVRYRIEEIDLWRIALRHLRNFLLPLLATAVIGVGAAESMLFGRRAEPETPAEPAGEEA